MQYNAEISQMYAPWEIQIKAILSLQSPNFN